MTTLRDLKPGERGGVVGWAGSAPPTRLLEMGVMRGTEIEVVKLAPLGKRLALVHHLADQSLPEGVEGVGTGFF